MPLRDRCLKFLRNIDNSRRPLVDVLMEFVIAENGRAAGNGKLDEQLPLCLYFSSDAERDDFIRMVGQLHPYWNTHKVN